MSYWFRPPIRCVDTWDAWLRMWEWIGIAHAEGWYVQR